MSRRDSHTLTVSAEGIATLQIANGTPLNILDSRTIAGLTGALREAASDRAIRMLVLRGSGDKAFVGGADIKEMATLEPASARAFITRLHDLCEAARDFPVPTVARLSGWCLGGGMELAACCDIRVGTTASRFAMPEVRIGIPSVIHARLLPRLIGEGRTRLLLLTGSAIDGPTAERWGFLEKLVEPDALDDAIGQVAAEILECGPAGVRLQKSLLRSWEGQTIERSLEASIEAFGAAYEGSEPHEYMQRFLEKMQAKRAG